jgi:hypothetical protein
VFAASVGTGGRPRRWTSIFALADVAGGNGANLTNESRRRCAAGDERAAVRRGQPRQHRLAADRGAQLPVDRIRPDRGRSNNIALLRISQDMARGAAWRSRRGASSCHRRWRASPARGVGRARRDGGLGAFTKRALRRHVRDPRSPIDRQAGSFGDARRSIGSTAPTGRRAPSCARPRARRSRTSAARSKRT